MLYLQRERMSRPPQLAASSFGELSRVFACRSASSSNSFTNEAIICALATDISAGNDSETSPSGRGNAAC
jgi:hypothetical protein